MVQLTQLVTLAILGSTVVVATSEHDSTAKLAARVKNAPTALVFDAKTIPDIVQNVCWGQRCEGADAKLTWDKPGKKVKASRRTAAGCAPNPNRCSTKKGAPKGLQCDEYPFASTIGQTNKNTIRVNRCVEAKQNSNQGGQISKFYANKQTGCANDAPCDFSVSWTNAQGQSHCNGNSQCQDQNQVKGPSNVRRDTSAPAIAPIKTFRTDTGMTFSVGSDSDMVVGGIAYTVVPINATLHEEHISTHVYDEDADYDQYSYMSDNLELQSHNVVEEL